VLEADVVVVGYGGAGATAGITAHDLGASVIIIEKTPTGGGNTCVSGGSYIAPLTHEHIPAAVSYINALNFGTTESDIIEAMIEETLKTSEWIGLLGGEAIPFHPFTKRQESYPRPPVGPNFPHIPGGECLHRFAVKGDDSLVAGRRLWDLLSANVSSRGIRVLTNAHATQLLQAYGGRVNGVAATSARRGCRGFARFSASDRSIRDRAA
jgi:succinate dehydrogenase/fumarate reductase flavoprotein subunit